MTSPLLAGVPLQRVLVIAEGDNPSFAYFVRPCLSALAGSVVLADSRKSPPSDLGEFSAVVVVRYLPPVWHPVLARMRAANCPVAYFMDDDLMDIRAHAGLPLRYRWKLMRRALWQRSAIEKWCSEFWVSTPWLAAKYAAWSPRVLDARADAQTAPPLLPVAAVDSNRVSICYHGTASHAAEQRWLVAVLRDLQARCSTTDFTIVGDASVRRLFRGIPRVSVLAPMDWPAYLRMTSTTHVDIALAPLLAGPFNAARAPTKFFDNTRMGAVGVYANVAPYAGFVGHGVDGVLLDMSVDVWVSELVRLAGNRVERRLLADAARQRVLAGVSPVTS